MNKQGERNAERTSGGQSWRSAPIGKEEGGKEKAIAAGTVLLMGLAIVLLVASIVLVMIPLADGADSFGEFAKSITSAHAFLVVLILVFLVPMVIVFAMTYRRLTGRERPRWVEVDAVCSDHQLLPVVNYTEEGEVHGWSYRLLCSFQIGDRTYHVTPHGHDGHQFHLFKSQGAAINFLRNYITSEGKCKLLVNQTNPQQTRLPGEKS
ncbi:MAG: hypothetical protein ACP5JG_07525 [Anaerolineae bacterium]